MTNLRYPFDLSRDYANLEQFLDFNGQRVIRFWVYRRMFTPLETQKCYMDQSCYESSTARFGLIRETIALPDGDVLLGIAEIYEDIHDLTKHTRSLEYFRLSELRIMYCPEDDAEYRPICPEREADT